MIFNKNLKGGYIKVKLILPAGSISVAPPVSTALGQYRVDMVQFTKAFNESTKLFEKGVLLPVKILLKAGGSVNFTFTTPSVTYLTKRIIVDLIKLKQKRLTNLMLYKILCIKMQNNKLKNLSVLRSILGTVKSMQINKYHIINN